MMSEEWGAMGDEAAADTGTADALLALSPLPLHYVGR